MVFFFSVTTPFGIVLGLALSNVYRENSRSSLITVGLLNASSSGLLIYMAWLIFSLQNLWVKSYKAALSSKSSLILLFFWVLVACLSWPNGLRETYMCVYIYRLILKQTVCSWIKRSETFSVRQFIGDAKSLVKV